MPRSLNALATRWFRVSLLAGSLVAAAVAAPGPATAQQPKRIDRQTYERGRRMLEQMRTDLRTHYYDSTHHGLDLDARFRKADSAMKLAPDSDFMFAIIAQYMAELDDSHTRFFPPTRAASVDYGFSMHYVGDTCFVAAVKKGSDAEAKGLAVGDAILQIDNIKLARANFSTIQYVYYQLRPRPGLRLLVKKVDGSERDVIAMAKITPGERIIDYTDPTVLSRLIQESDEASRRANHMYRSLGDTVMIWKMNSFIFNDEGNIAAIMREAKKHRALILDLRYNGGGSIKTQAFLIGQFFDREVPIATLKRRNADSTFNTEFTDKDPFRGMLLVLQNSNSASSSEMTARTLQLQGRGIIVGDRSKGAVVTSLSFTHELGFSRQVTYGSQISVMDVVMPDGGRLEKGGVTPDVLVLPTAADIAARRDPAMSKALSMIGVTMDPVEAARIYRGANLK